MKFWSQMPIKENPSMEDVLMLGDTLDVNNPKTITLQQMMDIAGEKVSSVEVVEELPAEGRENKLYIKKISQDDIYVYESYIWDDNAYHQMSNGGGTDEKTIRQIEHRGIDIMNYARGSGNNGFPGDVFGRIEKINNIDCIVYELYSYDDKQDIIKVNMDEITDMHHDPSKVNKPTIEEGILKGLRPINITATCRYIYDTNYSKPQVEIPITDEMWNYPVAFKGTFVNTHSYGDDYVGTPTTSIGMVYKNREGTTGTFSNPLTLRECYGHTIRLLVYFKFNPLNGRYLIKTPFYLLQEYISPEPEIRKLIGSLPERIQVLDHSGTSNDNSIVVFDYEGNPVIKIDSEMDRTGDNVTINYPCDNVINRYNQKAMQIKSDGVTIRKPGGQDPVALSVGVDKCYFGLNGQTCLEVNEAKTRVLTPYNYPSRFSVFKDYTYIVGSAIDKHLDYIIYNGQNYYENQRFHVASDGYAYKSEHAQESGGDIRLYELGRYNEVKIMDINRGSEIGIKDGGILIKAHHSPVLQTNNNYKQLILRDPFSNGDIIKTYGYENPSITFYSGSYGVDGQLLRWEHSDGENKNTVKLYGGDSNSIIESVCDLDNNHNKVITINKHHGYGENTIVIRDTDDEWNDYLNHKEGIHFIAKRLTFTPSRDDGNKENRDTKTLLAAGEETINMGDNEHKTITPKNEYRYTINNLNYGDNQALTIDGLNNGDFTIEFSIGNDIPKITFSNDIKFMSPPDFNSNQHWIIAVHNNYAVYAKYDL